MPSDRNSSSHVPVLLLTIVVLLVLFAASLFTDFGPEPTLLVQASTDSEVQPQILLTLQSIEDQLAQAAAERRTTRPERVVAPTGSGETALHASMAESDQDVRREPGDLPGIDARIGVDWGSVIDKSLAQCLVEHAKTPYDEGVAPLLRRASRELAAIHTEWYTSDCSLMEQIQLRADDLDARRAETSERKAAQASFEREERALRDVRDAAQEQARAQFREALAALGS